MTLRGGKILGLYSIQGEVMTSRCSPFSPRTQDLGGRKLCDWEVSGIKETVLAGGIPSAFPCLHLSSYQLTELSD